MAKQVIEATVLEQKELIPGVFDLLLQAEPIAAQAVPGQFVSVYTKNAAKLLPRPISLCGIDKELGTLRLVYRVTGDKTGLVGRKLFRAGLISSHTASGISCDWR